MLIYLLLGCNVGNCQQTFAQVQSELHNRIGAIAQKSALYKTDAWGNENQAPFLNQVIVCNTQLSPENCLTEILNIEQQQGRTRHEKWEPRTIDIDILLYENQVVDVENLKIPHPYLHLRQFALQPLSEINEQIMHPTLHKTIKQLLSEITDEHLKVNRL